MTCDSPSVSNLREAMFAFNFAHPLRAIEMLRVGMEAMSQANPPAAGLTVEPTEVGGGISCLASGHARRVPCGCWYQVP